MSEYRQARFAPSAGATEFILVRHGESAPAQDGVIFDLVDGQGDPELAPGGREQAERVGARLVSMGIDAVYVTTLRRTVETAAPFLAATGLTSTVEADLREVFLGEWEGGVFRRMIAEDGPVAQRFRREERWDVIPGAESVDAFAKRLKQAVTRLAEAHPGQRLAVFTHGGVIGELLAQAARSRPFAFFGPDNGSISHLVVEGSNWLVRGFNDTAHLDTDPAQPALPT
ncbi:histidine phosphatase family protein [Actinokineospora auranticolor]|uniref:Putative phosphoglycerate mutase n=1 Tax=Actinokineospora auranticolor TaxID=155976 RepID=A0A2S6GFP2_9PSEU|nr:histidine phosphatase family protein [Actinokineospora auranticolor]PPK64032.1 putative phosphoglycerate mutase [Actinokineospora auranticolor]